VVCILEHPIDLAGDGIGAHVGPERHWMSKLSRANRNQSKKENTPTRPSIRLEHKDYDSSFLKTIQMTKQSFHLPVCVKVRDLIVAIVEFKHAHRGVVRGHVDIERVLPTRISEVRKLKMKAETPNRDFHCQTIQLGKQEEESARSPGFLAKAREM
jgi:hypothetical protein